jgi:EEF1A N-terminal glycine/lysine methyltransferase
MGRNVYYILGGFSNSPQVVITDYPDPELIENIQYNVANCGIGQDIQDQIRVEGYRWGGDPSPLLSHLVHNDKFDVIILSDTVYPLALIAYHRYLIIQSIAHSPNR